jgi:hypothetical protein
MMALHSRLSARSGLNALHRFLIQRESQHRERAVVEDFDVRELALVAVEHDASVFGDKCVFSSGLFSSTGNPGD